jgi:hypothetical protein
MYLPAAATTLFTAMPRLVEGDVNGDAKADIQIEVADTDHSMDWDFSTAGNVSIL